MKLSMTRDTKISLLLAAAALLIVGLGYYFLVKPQSDEAAAAKEETTALEQQKTALSGQLEELEKDTGEQLPEFYRASKAAPLDFDAPGAVLELTTLADDAGVDISSIQVSSIQERDGYRAPQFALTVNGRFAEINQFLKSARTLVVVRGNAVSPRGNLFRVETFDLHEGDGPSGSLEAILELTTTLPVSAEATGAEDGTAVSPSDNGDAPSGDAPSDEEEQG
jgi:hypothetical protein